MGGTCRRSIKSKRLRVRLVLMSPEKVVIEKSLRLDFPAMNNEAEYETLLEGMTMVQRMGGKSIKLFSDSKLVVGQVRGEFEAKDERMQGYLNQVKSMQSKFDSLTCYMFPEVAMHTRTLWPCLQPPRHRTCLE